MAIGMRRLALFTVLLLVVVGITGAAYGFFPKGGFNLNQQLRYATWSFKEFDTNSNGAIEQGEGLEFRIEGGPRGFTLDEIEQVKAGFQTWQDVPTSYAAFRFVGVIEDPIIPGVGLPDYLPQVFMQVTGIAEDDGYAQPDDPEFIIQSLSGGLLALTLTLYTIDITAIPVGGNVVIVPAGTILDCDIVVDASWFRYGVLPGNTLGTLDLQAVITSAVGSLLGLGYTPLNNIDPFNNVSGLSAEPAIVQVTGTDGIARMIGATPTMFPDYFLTQEPGGQYKAGWLDLAPDDISGVSWLYPREDGLENFFTIQHEARTQVRSVTGIPSAPISGAHIVAWADVSNSPSERRVPLFSTMSGLYNVYTDTQLSGRFIMQGLWKQMEVPGRIGELFEPSYVMTMSPLNGLGYERQAPPGMSASMFDSMQGPFPVSVSTITRPSTEFSTNYPSEVFNEDGNIYGVDNYAAGTPLVWSFQKNAVVSANSNKTLPRMLPRNMPMFGDPDRVCPMNIIENPGGTNVDAGDVTLIKSIGNLNNKLRGFRDNTLLRSAVGTALVELYYRVAPYVSYQMLQHEAVMHAAKSLILASLWIWERVMAILFLVAATLILAVLHAARRHFTPAVRIAAVLIAIALFMAVASHAVQVPLTVEQLVAESTYIVSGKVVSAEGVMDGRGRISTNVVFKVSDTAKGDVNRGSVITFTVIGGQYGTLALAASGLPGFTTDENAVVYLKDIPNYGLVPCGGLRGKVPIIVDPETEEEEVDTGDGTEGEAVEGEGEAVEGEGEAVEGEQAKSVRTLPVKADHDAKAGRMPLRAYMRYLRSIANSQR